MTCKKINWVPGPTSSSQIVNFKDLLEKLIPVEAKRMPIEKEYTLWSGNEEPGEIVCTKKFIQIEMCVKEKMAK